MERRGSVGPAASIGQLSPGAAATRASMFLARSHNRPAAKISSCFRPVGSRGAIPFQITAPRD